MSHSDLHDRPSLSRHSSSSSHSHSHSHSHADSSPEEAHDEVSMLISALTGNTNDKGSRITLIGLFANIGSTVIKAAAGWALNSASLVADAGHSLSDLMGDFVVLFCWKLSRRPPSDLYPFGYGKYESIGTFGVAVMLILGAVGIAIHSTSVLQDVLFPAMSHSHSASSHSHSHSYPHTEFDVKSTLFHSHSHDIVDPKAAWFALASVLLKEYLYRITMKVAKEEKSNVLEASALHHRSDAFSGIIALAAIGTSSLGLTIADPIGGLLVALMILKQGVSLALASIWELLDASPDKSLPSKLTEFLETEESDSIRKVESVRTYNSGGYSLVEIVVVLKDAGTSVARSLEVERRISDKVKEFVEGGAGCEVIVRFRLREKDRL